MKTKVLGILLGLASAAMAGTVAKEGGDRGARASVTFLHPETYADIAPSGHSADREREGVLRTLGRAMQQSAAQYLRDDLRLEIQVTDVDLAGDIQGWRGAAFDDLRVVSDLYPPRMSVAYRLSDARGRLLTQGEARLSNINFLFGTQADSLDPLRHDKALFRDWVRTEFAAYRK